MCKLVWSEPAMETDDYRSIMMYSYLCRSMSVKVLLDDFGHDDLIIALLRGHLEQHLGCVSRARLITFTPDVEDTMRVGHRFDAFDIDCVELVEVAKNVVQLGAELGLFGVGKIEPR